MKLNRASDPTAMIAGTRKPKMSKGRSSTPPPRPVSPISVPTEKPIRILIAISISNATGKSARLTRLRSRRHHRLLTDSDKSLTLQMQNNFLRRLFRGEFRGIDHHFGIRGRFIGIGDSGELFHDTRACFRVKSLAVALLADFERRRHMHENEAAVSFDHVPNLLAHGIVRRDGGADRDAAVLG